MQFNVTPGTLGAVLAVLVLIAAFVLALMGLMSWPVAGCLIGLSVARLT